MRVADDCELAHGMVGLDHVVYADFIFHSNESVYAMADKLAATAAAGRTKELGRLEQSFGIKFNDATIMFDRSLRFRGIYRPLDHYLRDWMHVICNNGVANTHIGLLLHVLKDNVGLTPDIISDNIQKYELPRKYGKVQRTWITDNRLKDDHLSSFAGTVLSLVPILYSFLVETCKGAGIDGHIQCLKLLRDIINILKLGPDRVIGYADRLRTLIELHAQLFCTLYPGAEKPKWHHMFHLVDNLLWLGKLLSCFATERKHRASKASALHVFRNMESTVLTDMINKACESMCGEDGALFKITSCLQQRQVQLGSEPLLHSSTALLECGEIKNGDIVWLNSDIVGRVVCYWRHASIDNEYMVQIAAYGVLKEGMDEYFNEDDTRMHFTDATSIIDACIWVYKRPRVLRVLPPAAVQYR